MFKKKKQNNYCWEYTTRCISCDDEWTFYVDKSCLEGEILNNAYKRFIKCLFDKAPPAHGYRLIIKCDSCKCMTVQELISYSNL